MLTIEKGPSVLEHQTGQRKINSRFIIPRNKDFRPVCCLWGFIGSVKEFKQALKAQQSYLNAGIIAP